MKKGLILINAYAKLQQIINQSERLKYELEKVGVAVDIRRNDFFASFINGAGDVQSRAQGYDFCIYLDKEKCVSAMLEKCGMRLFNSHTAVEVCDDKMVTSIALAGNGIPMPVTLAGLLCYEPSEKVREETLEKIENILGYPLIVKTSYGSLGKGVFKIDDRKSLAEICEKLKCTPHLFQQFIKTSVGRDIRVIVIGGKFVAAMVRKSNSDFRSNIELGGTGTKITPPDEVISMCEKTAKILNLDYCGIDVLFGDGNYYICEVNSNAFFGGIEKVTGVNVAAAYAAHIRKTIYGGMN